MLNPQGKWYSKEGKNKAPLHKHEDASLRHQIVTLFESIQKENFVVDQNLMKYFKSFEFDHIKSECSHKSAFLSSEEEIEPQDKNDANNVTVGEEEEIFTCYDQIESLVPLENHKGFVT